MKQQNNTEQKPLQTPLQDKGNGHTPGEWVRYIQPDEDGLVTTINAVKPSKRIATLSFVGIEETEANAQLIILAPQLKAQNETLAWDVNRLAVDNQEKEDTIKELFQMVIDLKSCIKRLTQDDLSQFDKDTEAQWEGEAHELLTRIAPNYYKNANE